MMDIDFLPASGSASGSFFESAPPSPTWYDYDSEMLSSASSARLEFHVDPIETKLEYTWKDSEGGAGPFVSRQGSNDLMWGASPGYASPLAVLLDMTPPQSPFSADKHVSVAQCPPMMVPLIGNPDVVLTIPKLTTKLTTSVLKGGRAGKRKYSTSSVKSDDSADAASWSNVGDMDLGASLDGLPENKRSTHNVLERKRRHDLKNSYKALRSQIPDIENNDRTPTGHILVRAHEVIQDLQTKQTQLVLQIEAVRAKNAALKQQVGQGAMSPYCKDDATGGNYAMHIAGR